MRRVLMILMGMVLVIIFVMEMYSRVGGKEGAMSPTLLAEVLPGQLDGWLVETGELSAKEAEVLLYDDVVLRRYIGKGIDIEIYVAYWGAGKMAYDLVGFHVPDVCWGEVGWDCDDKETRESTWLKPYEWRRFSKEEVTREVVFWHMIGGRSHAYTHGNGYEKGFMARVGRYFGKVGDLFRFGLRQNEGQYLVRVVSLGRDFEGLVEEKGFRELMELLGVTGVLFRSEY